MGVKNRERRRAKKQRRQREEAAGGAHRQAGEQVARAAVLAAAEAFRSEPEPAYRVRLEELAALDARAGRHLVDGAVAWWADLGLDRAWASGWQPADVPRFLDRKLGPAHAAAVTPAVAASAARRVERAGDERWGAQVAVLAGAAPHAPRPDRAVAVEALSLLLRLPPLPRLSAPSDSSAPAGTSAAMLERVRALLAKAESTTFPEEAEAFTAKAQELMARHAIDAALLEARNDTGPGQVCGWRIGVDDPYGGAKAQLLHRIAKANRSRAVWCKELGFSTVFGTPTDLQVVELLFTSLLVQATRAMLHAGRSVDRSGRSRTRSFRQSFLLAFATRIGERLEVATAEVVREQAAHHEALLPVLASRSEAVDDAVEAAYPGLRHHSMSVGNHAGWVAGRAAADLASLSVGEGLPAGS